MHFSGSYEKNRRRARSSSPRRVRRTVSISAFKPRRVEPLPDYYGGYPVVNTVSVPAPPAWVSTNHTPLYSSSYQPPPTYYLPGAYPASPSNPYPGSYLFQQSTSSNKKTMSPTEAWDGTFKYKKPEDYVKQSPTIELSPPNPLDDPAVRSEIAHEQKMRSFAEQRNQELMKQQRLGIEIAKASAERQQGIVEGAARQRMHRLYMLSLQEQGQQLAPYVPRRSRSTHSVHRVRSNTDLRLELYHDEARRASHVCSRCRRRGHYSRECTGVPYTHLLEAPPSGSQAGSVYRSSSRRRARSRSRGRSSSRGSVRSYSDDEYDDEEWDEDDVYDEDAWYSDDEMEHYYCEEKPRGRVVRGVPSDQGVLVVYTPGGGPGTRRYRRSVRHVVGG